MTQAVQANQPSSMLFGERLIAEGLLASRDLERALAAQREMGGYIGDVLTRLGLIAEQDLFRMLAEHLQVDWIQKDDFPEAPLDLSLIHISEPTRPY